MFSFNMATHINDDLLVEFVHNCPIVWDLRQLNYRKISKDDAWNEIGKRLNCTGNEARIRFSTLREKFRKEKLIYDQCAINGEEYKSVWPLYDRMTFLEQVIKPRRKRTHQTSGSLEFNDYSFREDNFNYADLPSPPIIPSPATLLQPQSDEIASSSTASPYNTNHINKNTLNPKIEIEEPDPSSPQSEEYNNSHDEIMNSHHHHMRQQTNATELARQFLHELTAARATVQTKTHHQANKFKSFGQFIGDHLTSLPQDDADQLMKSIMREIINYIPASSQSTKFADNKKSATQEQQ